MGESILLGLLVMYGVVGVLVAWAMVTPSGSVHRPPTAVSEFLFNAFAWPLWFLLIGMVFLAHAVAAFINAITAIRKG